MSIEHGYITAGHQPIHISRYRPIDLTGVTVIAQPIGPEYMHCKAAVRQLVHTLSQQGQLAIVFDWPGYGQSSGQLPNTSDPELFEKVLEDLVQYAKKVHSHVSLICLRSAALMLERTLSNCDLTHLNLWYPITQGKAFIRDVQLIDHALGVDQSDTHIEAGGYPISLNQIAQFETRSFKGFRFDQCTSASIIHAPEVKRLSFLKEMTNAIENVSVEASNGLAGMARQAELSEVPWQDIEKICESIKGYTEVSALNTPLSSSFSAETFKESAHVFGPNLNYGILTEPVNAADTAERSSCLIIPNTGSGHCSGPNGLHTMLSRHLAELGISTLRFDLRHLGNSGHPDDNNREAYTEKSADDINHAVSFAKDRGFQRISLFGICAGAFSVFSFARELIFEARIQHLFLVNPNTLHWEKGDDPYVPDSVVAEAELDHHSQQIHDPRAWLALLLSPQKWLRIFRSGLKMLLTKLRGAVSRSKTSMFEHESTRALKKTQQIHLIFSPDDIGVQTIGKQLGDEAARLIEDSRLSYEILQTGDHTFTRLEDRLALTNYVSKCMIDDRDSKKRSSPVKSPAFS